MKIVYISSVEVGKYPLMQLIQQKLTPDLVISLSPKMKDKTSGFIDYGVICQQFDLPNWQVLNLNHPKWLRKLKALEPDLIIVCGWQRLLNEEVLKLPKYGTIGFHASILPKFRGRAPINWALILGEKESGVTCFYLEPEADTGKILMQESFPILLEDDCNTLYEKVAITCSNILTQILPKIKQDTLQVKHNESKYFPCYPKRSPQDGVFDFNRNTLDIYNWIRAQTKPYPGAFYIEDGHKYTVWKSLIGEFPKLGLIKQTLDGFITLTDLNKEKVSN
ncbi:methionyl-tRNA formyltransferase [bacterium]|nr:methionyl-tRNA formyltransferase [bacterium]